MNAVMPRTILIVEDDFLTAMMERKQLEREEYTVLHAASGEKAIELVLEQAITVDLILMDIDLGSGMDGTDTARRILAVQDIPVVFLSSHTEKEIVQKTEQITSYGYVVKSSSFTVLDASIKMAFKLFESKKMYKRTFDHNLSGICVHRMLFDASGAPYDCEYLKVNDAYERHTGFSAAFLAGKTIRELYPEGQADGVIRMYAEVLRSGVPVQKEFFFKPLDGWFQTSVYTLTNDEFTVVLQNITEHKRAIIELEESETRFKALHNASFGGIAIHEKGIILECNQGMSEMTGYKPDELIGMDGLLLIAEDLRPKVRANIAAGVEKPYEAVGLRKNGETYPLRLEARNIPYKGRTVRVVEFRDITEIMQSRDELEKNHAYLHSILETMQDGFWAIDPQQRFTDVNAAYCAMSGYTRDEFLELHIQDIDAEEQPEETDAHMRRILETGHDVFETRHRRKDGSTFLVEVSVMYLTEPEIRLICFCRDVTERKRLDAALRSSESELKKAQQFGNIGSWIWHIQENRLEWSEQMFSIFGISKEKFTGDLSTVIASSIHPEDRAEVERSNDSVAKQGKPVPLEYRIIRPDGVVRAVWAEAGELEKDSDGRPTLLRGIVQDITDRKRVEDRIRVLLLEKDLLLKETHHRIKNDMNMIYSLLYLQANNQSNADASNVLLNAASRTQGMLMLYEKLYCSTDYNKLSTRTFLSPLIDEILHVLPVAASIRTEVEIEDFMLTARILSRLGIIVNELITNSVKYAFKGKDEGIVCVSVSVDGTSARFEYSDDGPGLPAGTDFGRSSGFGMQLIGMMVEEIGGTVEIVRNGCANFIIRWPL